MSSASSQEPSASEKVSALGPDDNPVPPETQHPEGGCLPAWGVAELPAPPPFSLRSAVRLIGPAAIALGTAIGSGEWLLGPAVTAKYGATLLWVATASILLQVILNQEMMRYTIATGEPIFTGFLRTKPGPTFWGPFYTLFMMLQIGWPAWALSGATALAAMYLGRITGDADKGLVQFFGCLTFIVTVLIIASGGKIEKTLERVEWFMIGWILIFMLIVGLFFVSGANWMRVAGGFLGLNITNGSLNFSARLVPEPQDWRLLAAFAAYAGMGGLGNGTITNWMRDKGWGMAATVGHIPGIIGGKAVHLSRVGNVFAMTDENRSRFAEWMRYVKFEQAWIFGLGCFLGMGLPALMTLQFIPPGVDITGNNWQTATYQAQGLGRAFGQAALFLTLLNGFWILFSTQLGNTDMFARTVTDMVWSTHPDVQKWAKDDVRRVYYTVLLVFTAFGMWAIFQSSPGGLLLLGASIAVFNFMVLGTHVLVVQRKFLPRELRMPLWRECAIVLFILMFATFLVLGLWSQWDKILAAFGLGK